MSTLCESPVAFTKPTRTFLTTGSVRREAVATLDPGQLYESELRSAWERIEEQLFDWAESPDTVDEDGLRSPSVDAIRLALTAIRTFRPKGYPPPNRVVEDGDGGIALKWIKDQNLVSVEFREDGSTRVLRFDGPRLVSHDSFP